MNKREKKALPAQPGASNRIRWEFAVLVVLAAVMYTNPFASYRYNGGVYTVNGLDFIFGKTVYGGKLLLSGMCFLSFLWRPWGLFLLQVFYSR